MKSHDIIFTKLIKFLKNLIEFLENFPNFFKVSSQASFTLRKIAEHVSSCQENVAFLELSGFPVLFLKNY